MTDSAMERRQNQRILFDAPARIEVDGVSYQTRVLDISLNGALVAAPSDWAPAPGYKLSAHVKLNEETEIHMQAEVAHVRDGQVGLHRLQIDMDSICHLRRLVELNLGDEELLNRELGALG